MKNFVTCSQRDYDFYTIPFPLNALKKDRRNKYIYSELGKLHPCFSDDCCFDVKLHLKKTGLMADVVVMQKIRLAEYKAKSRNIYIEERKRIPFFKGYKSDKTLYLVILVLLAIGGFIFLRNVASRKKAENVSAVPKELAYQNKTLSVRNICVLLKTICESGGSVLQFEWKTDGFTEHTCVTIRGVFPEQLLQKSADISFSSVVFEDEVPLMTVNLAEKIPAPDFSQELGELNRADFRSFVLQEGALITQETVSPYGMNIVIPQKAGQPQNDVFCSIIDFLISNEMSVSVFNLNQNENLMNISIEFLPVKTDAFAAIGNALVEQNTVFQNIREEQLSANDTAVMKNQSPQFQDQQNDLTKIGQVTKPDGNIITFYKNTNGKIISIQGR